MRALWISIVVIALAGVAEASPTTVVVMSDPARAGELAAALQVALAGRGVAIASAAQPGGALRLDRAAAAQRAAVQIGADAALWIDLDIGAADVCVVSADGRSFRHAPLPGDAAGDSPRVFAAVATSLLDELVAPPEGFAVGVDVHVDVAQGPPTGAAYVPGAPPGAPFALGPPPPYSPPGVVAALPDADGRVRPDRTLLEIGPMLSPFTGGVEAEVAFPLTPQWRLGLLGNASLLFLDQNPTVLGGGFEIRHVGASARHFDFGFVGGGEHIYDSSMTNNTIVFAGLRMSFVREYAASGASLSLVPVIAADGRGLVPGIFASARWELPL